jgi:hypothetical protein
MVPHICLNIPAIPNDLLAILYLFCITANKQEYNAWFLLRFLINILKLSDKWSFFKILRQESGIIPLENINRFKKRE